MDQKLIITTVEEWRDLPEIRFPSISSTSRSGAAYCVLKVGFIAASPEQCRKGGVIAEAGPANKCLLPTVVVEFSGEPQMCRLPLELAPWAFNCVAMARDRLLGFPAQVEFGVLEGRLYADFVE